MSTHNIPFSIYKKKGTRNYPKFAAISFSQGLYEFETAVVNEPAVFETLRFLDNQDFQMKKHL